MKWSLIACAALVAATPALAKRKEKPAEEPPPPAPTEIYENSDIRMGETMTEACVGAMLTGETYDGRDGVYIIATEGGGYAFLHFKAGCTFNAMMFAEKATPRAADGRCLKPGDAIAFSDSFGGVAVCEISQVNSWHPEREALPEYDASAPY